MNDINELVTELKLINQRMEIIHKEGKERMEIIRGDVSEVKAQLVKLNGQVKENTAARNQQKIINIVLGTIGTIVLSVAIGALFS